MPIDFELSKEQLGLRMQAREFGDQILKLLRFTMWTRACFEVVLSDDVH